MNVFLPVLLPAFSTLVALAVVLMFTNLWVKDQQSRQIINRGALVVATLVLAGFVIFAVNTAVVQPSDTLDRASRQEQQQNDLQRRLDQGGH